MVPEGWKIKSIRDVVKRVRNPATVEPNKLYREIGIRSHCKGIFHKEPVSGREIGNKSVFWVEPECLVLNIVFAWEQAVAKTTKQETGYIASHRFPQYLPSEKQVDIDYLLYFFNTKLGKHFLGLASPGGAGRNKTLGQQEFAKIEILLPPISEQTKIARILSTWDRAIEATEKLIENSRRQKKALMQQLLTGKKRLPGFKGEWREVSLEEIADVWISNVDKKTKKGEQAVRLCNYTDVYYNEYIVNDMMLMKATASKKEINRFSLRKGDVLITKDSETPDDIAVPALVDEKLTNVVCGYHLSIVRPHTNAADGEFLALLFSLPKTRYYFFTLANGATRFGLSANSIRNARFFIPELEDQKRIARVLRNMSNGINNFAKQLEVMKQQKQAFMQQLLTGKRRVKVDELIPAALT